jgi:hypothetical protein
MNRAASNGYLVPHLPPATDKPMVWSEFDDHGKHFADFEEVSHAGNCRKCASVVIFDKRGCLFLNSVLSVLMFTQLLDRAKHVRENVTT